MKLIFIKCSRLDYCSVKCIAVLCSFPSLGFNTFVTRDLWLLVIGNRKWLLFLFLTESSIGTSFELGFKCCACRLKGLHARGNWSSFLRVGHHCCHLKVKSVLWTCSVTGYFIKCADLTDTGLSKNFKQYIFQIILWLFSSSKVAAEFTVISLCVTLLSVLLFIFSFVCRKAATMI